MRGRFKWMDFLNGSTGSLIDQFLVGAGFLAFLLTFSVTPIWFAAVLGLLIGLGAPVLLHFKCPGLYMTAEEKNDAFERTRRFGRNR